MSVPRHLLLLSEPAAALLYLLGFWAPWERYLSDHKTATAWLALSTLLPRTGLLPLPAATLAVTLGALVCVLVGTVLGVWSAAAKPSSPAVHALGRWLFACGVAVLMPLAGAPVFLIALGALEIVSARTRPAPETHGWQQALLGEAFPIAFTACMAVLLWRYQPQLLIKCLLVCYGLGLVLRAFAPRATGVAA